MPKPPRSASRARFKAWLIRRFSLRLHMSLVLLCTGLSGVFSGWALYHLGVQEIVFRYPLAIFIAYGVFFVLLRIWLTIILPSHPESRDSVDIFDFGTGSSRSPSSGSTLPRYQGGGGRSGGGGASGNWDSDTSPPLAAVAMSSPRPAAAATSKSSGSKFDLDLGDDAGGLAILIAGAVLIFVILGSAAYFVYDSPNLLAESAFQFALSAGLIKKSRGALGGNWITTPLRKTWIPVAIVLVLAIGFGLTVQTNMPGATTLAEIARRLRER